MARVDAVERGARDRDGIGTAGGWRGERERQGGEEEKKTRNRLRGLVGAHIEHPPTVKHDLSSFLAKSRETAQRCALETIAIVAFGDAIVLFVFSTLVKITAIMCDDNDD